MTKVVVSHDFETFCELDVRRVGAHKYARHPSCDVLCLTWGTTPEDIRTWVPHRQKKMPPELVALVEDPNVMWEAHNSEFEFCIWRHVMQRRYKAPVIPLRRFCCTAARAAAAGLPRALDKVGAALRLDIQKDKEGTRLLNKFAKPQAPRKPSKKNPDGIPSRRIMPWDEPDEFKKLLDYNRTDVLAEMAVAEHTPAMSAREQRYFSLALEMNYRGLPIDMKAVEKAMPVLTELENRVTREVMKLTGGVRPTQRDKMMEFLNGTGLDLENLQAKTIKDLLLLKRANLTPKQIRLLQLRIEGGKASTKKLKKILEVVCDDGRVRGAFMFNGATTGRFAGKMIQPQNFTRGEYKPWEYEVLFGLLYLSDPDVMELLYEWPIDAIAQGMRGFIYTMMEFYVSDFSAIEARMLAWLADETEVLEAYHKNVDVYIRMACKLYRLEEAQMIEWCKVEQIPARVLQRKFAKDIVLGCGYQMGGQGFYNNCIKRGIVVELEECKRAVKVYRAENPKTVQFWYDTERCAIQAVKQERTKNNPIVLRHVKFYLETIKEYTWLCIELPSGRPMRYPEPKVNKVERFGEMRDQLSFRSELNGHLWIRETTYGGKLVENITQAVARDVMMEAWERATLAGFKIVGTVHDELIAENDPFFGKDKDLDKVLQIRPKWCPDAPINAEGWQGKRYRK